MKSAAWAALAHAVAARGYDLQPITAQQRRHREAMIAAEQDARAAYRALDEATKVGLPERLDAKYRDTPVLGRVHVYDAIAALATIIDPLDPYLGAISQLTHQLQLVRFLEEDGMDEAFVVIGLVHDLGKLLITYGDEDLINVEAGGGKVPLRGTPGAGLDQCLFRWDHGDFAYLRLKDHLPPDLAWVIRYHSIDIAACRPYMNRNELRWCEELLVPFTSYDLRKSLYALPTRDLSAYRPLLDRTFPEPILI